MTDVTSICVYCGSNTGASPAYTEAAEELGRALARDRVRLVYGGGSIGLMGIVARTTLAHGGSVTGIIPQFLKDREVMLKEVSELIVTNDMHERKRAMFERADAFVTLPGGIGTLEEVVEIATWAQLEQHAKPIVMVNVAGFWDALVSQFDRMARDGFLAKDFIDSRVELPLTIVGSAAEALPAVRRELAVIKREDLAAADGARLM